MAKKTTTKKTTRRTTTKSSGGSSSGVSKKRDRETIGKIKAMGESVVKDSLALKEPVVDIPLRTVSNTKYSKKRRILEMGSNKQHRELFNFGMSRKFMQTGLLANGCKELVEAEKTLSLRGMYYKTLHTIPGTNEKTFDGQDESDPIIEDLEVSLGALREELHVFAKKAGTMVGNITVVDSGDEIDCRRMGSGGYASPSIVEPGNLQFK